MTDLHEDLAHAERCLLELDAEIAPLVQKREYFARRKATLESRLFIAKHKITRDQVEMPSDTHWHLADFGRSLRGRARKPWAAWNTVIFRTDEILAGRLPREDRPGRVDDLPYRDD